MKKCLCMFLALVFVLGICASAPITITANAASVDDLTFELNEDGKSYSVFAGNQFLSGNVEIPDEYNGKPVTTIGEFGFQQCSNIVSVKIPASVTDIKDYAFYNCPSLVSVKTTSGLQNIGSLVFALCSSLSSVAIPDTVKNIEPDAFAFCSSITSIEVDGNNQDYSSIDGVVFDNSGKVLVYYPAGKIENFYAIPQGVVVVGEAAFSYNQYLVKVEIPDSVKSIGPRAFCMAESLESIVIPDSVTNLGVQVFEGCQSLESVVLPSNVYEIPQMFMDSCENLKSITIPENVTFIGEYAFSYCPSLESVILPVSLNGVDRGVFYNCSSLNTVYYCGSKADWDKVDIIEDGNEDLLSCNIEYNFKLPSDVHTHSYTEEILKPATCTEKGSTRYSCSCGYIFTEDTPALGHDFSPEFTIDVYPSYESAGSQSRHCTRCDATTDVTVLPKLEKFDPPVITKAVSEKNGVRLTWQPVAGVESYMVFKLIDGKYTQIAVLNPSATTYLDSDVEEGETYCYAIASTNYMGDPGDYSEIAVKYTKAVKLQTPTVSRANTTKGIKVTWNAVPDAESYIVYRGIYNAKTKKWSGWKVVKNGYTGTTYTDTTVKLGTYYRYTVRAVSGESKSAYKATKGLKYNVTPTVKVANASNGIKVSWTTAANATGYAVYTSTYNASTKKWSGWKYRGTTAASTKSWVDKSAKSSTYYKYTVRAVNGSFKSSYKSSANVIRLLTPTVKASAQKNGIKITWNKIAGAKNYKIYRSEYVNGQWTSWTYIAARTYKALSYVDTTVSGGHTYRYTVRAVNGNSAGAYRASNQVNAPVKASPVTTLKNYLKQNGELSRDGDYYYIDYIEEVDNIEYEYTIWYDWYEDEISFSLYLYDYEKDSEHITDMVFVPNAATQDVTMIYFADSYDEYYGMGYVYTNETFTSDSYIYDFRISEGSEQLRESSAKLALLTTEIMLKKCDKMLSSRNVGVSMYDLGFVNLYN